MPSSIRSPRRAGRRRPGLAEARGAGAGRHPGSVTWPRAREPGLPRTAASPARRAGQALAARRRPVVVARPREVPRDADLERLAGRVATARRPLIVAGEVTADELEAAAGALGDAVDALARASGAPVIAEPSSGLRRRGGVHLVPGADALLRAGFGLAHVPDLVVRIGAAPTSKELNPCSRAPAPSRLSWTRPGLARPGLGGGRVLAHGPDHHAGGARRPLHACRRSRWTAAWLRADRCAQETLDRLLDETALHEGHVVRALAAASSAPGGARLPVFVGSSLPIRDVDTFWPAADGIASSATRGASGSTGWFRPASASPTPPVGERCCCWAT